MSIHDFGSAAARTELQAARRVVARSIHDGELVKRGKYLVTIASCTDCHTLGHFLGKSTGLFYQAGLTCP